MVCFSFVFSSLMCLLGLRWDFSVELDFMSQIKHFTSELTQTKEILHASHAVDAWFLILIKVPYNQSTICFM